VALSALATGCDGSDDGPSAESGRTDADVEPTDYLGDPAESASGCALWRVLTEPAAAPSSPVAFVQLVAIESFEWPSESTLVLTPRGDRSQAIIAAVRERQRDLGEVSVVESVREEPPDVIIEIDSTADPSLVYEQLEPIRIPCDAG
jgi:hypothetical protein